MMTNTTERCATCQRRFDPDQDKGRHAARLWHRYDRGLCCPTCQRAERDGRLTDDDGSVRWTPEEDRDRELGAELLAVARQAQYISEHGATAAERAAHDMRKLAVLERLDALDAERGGSTS